MAMIQFTHVGKSIVAVNPGLVFSIEGIGQGSVGAYTRIRSTGEAHVDVKENFATVIARLGLTLIEIQAQSESEAAEESTPDEVAAARTGFSWEQA